MARTLTTGLATPQAACLPIDIHCHQNAERDHLQILSLDTHQLAAHGQSGDLVSPSVGYFSIGIHPWFIERQNIAEALQTLTTVLSQSNALAIGECGLDKCISTPLAQQVQVFVQQIELAEALDKPLIIHCVRAFNELLQIKKARKTSVPWIIHGFNANPVVAAQLIKKGCYLSFGKALLNERSHAQKALMQTPLERVFLETDAAEDMPIGEVYAAAAKITALPILALQQQIFKNFERVFPHD